MRLSVQIVSTHVISGRNLAKPWKNRVPRLSNVNRSRTGVEDQILVCPRKLRSGAFLSADSAQDEIRLWYVLTAGVFFVAHLWRTEARHSRVRCGLYGSSISARSALADAGGMVRAAMLGSTIPTCVGVLVRRLLTRNTANTQNPSS